MPFRITIPLLVLAAFVAIGLATGQNETLGDDDVIKIVSSLPRTGSARGQTDTIVKGIQLALENVNYEVTAGGKTYKLKYEDLDDATAAAGQWTIEQEIANANQAVKDPDVMVYIGTYNSGAAKVSLPILNRARILMVSPANTAPALTKDYRDKDGELIRDDDGNPLVFGELHEPNCYQPSGVANYCRVVPTDNLQGELAALWTRVLINERREKVGKPKATAENPARVYVLDDNQYYGKGIATTVAENLREYPDVQVLGQQSINFKANEFKTLMLDIKTQKPELIYFGGTSQSKAGQLFKDMIGVGMNCPMMAPDGCYEQAMIDSVGVLNFKPTKINPDPAKFYATFGGVPIEALTTEQGKKFVEAYTKLYGSPPAEAYAAYGYECGLVALQAIRDAGTKDREAIRKAGMAIKDFDGMIGKWSFDENGDTTNQTMSGNVVTVVDDKAVFKLSRLLKLEDFNKK